MRDDIVTALLQMTQATFGAATPGHSTRPANTANGLIAPEAHAAFLLALAQRPQARRRAA